MKRAILISPLPWLLLLSWSCQAESCIENNLLSAEHQVAVSSDLHTRYAYASAGFRYSQCQTFFKLPARQNLELQQFFDTHYHEESHDLNDLSDGIFSVVGVSLDIQLFTLGPIYGALGLGFHLKSGSAANQVVSSDVMFSQRYALGWAIDQFILEFHHQHYSNGGLTEINRGYDLIGFSLSYNFK